MEFELIFLGTSTLLYLVSLLYWVFLKDWINTLDLSTNGYLNKLYTRVSSLMTSNKASNSFITSLSGILTTGSVLTFVLIGSYWFFFPDLQHLDEGFGLPGPAHDWFDGCNLFDGKWVYDDSYVPLYNASQCPFVENGFDCLSNGRRDNGFMKWRWKPRKCDIPRVDIESVLRYLRGRRVVFVGDSLTRTQWESFICMLMSGVDDKRFVYEVNGNKISKDIRFLNVRFDSYNFTVEFYRSVFLVSSAPAPKRSPKRVKFVLRLDKMDSISDEWIDSDVLVFNTGHWWTKTKLFETGTYFQVDGSLKLGMPVNSALKKALQTWASWVESRVNRNRTHVFFRTFESSHWSGRKRNTCKVSRRPSSTTQGREKSPVSDSILRVVKSMSAPVTPLHVTPMGAYRSDAHVGTWGDQPSVQDCSHWCLPGLPDTWNEILLLYLLRNDETK